MPELPEVETARLSIDKVLKGKRIAEIQGDADDRFFFAGTSLAEVKRALEGATVKGTGRKGKYFWIQLDRRPWPLFHLGMTGNIEIRSAGGRGKKAWGGVKLWSAGDAEAPGNVSWFCRFRLVTEDGLEVALTDPRRFGRIWLADDPLVHARVAKLGFDPLQKFPTARELKLLLAKRKAPIKAVLLDQALFAGVGNWLADEILFQAALSPRRPAAGLSAAEVARLRSKMLAIIRKAVAVGADYERFPRGWLFHFRWGKEKNARTHAKQKIRHDEIGGRTTAWVPSVQK